MNNEGRGERRIAYKLPAQKSFFYKTSHSALGILYRALELDWNIIMD